MMRLAGLLAGSVLGAAILASVAGIPRLAGPDAAVDTADTLPSAAPAAPAPGAADRIAPPPAEPLAAEPVPAEPPPAEAVLPETAPVETAQPVETTPASLVAAAKPASPPPLRWHAFWSPFRSRVAANGFVAELSRVTGLDYRVVAIEPGVYEVAFGYEDEAEIDAKLATIRAATGLDMPGS
ncbi:MAG: hypothetical protein R3176_02320 [Woeseiaceae bacterium]|nr:hypothetical protein [Woeseiaceae bacterium]